MVKKTEKKVIDFRHAAVQRAQQSLRRSAATRASLIDLSVENYNIQGRVHHLALLIAASPSGFALADLVRDVFADILSLSSAALVVSHDHALAPHPKTVAMDAGFLPRLTMGELTYLGTPQGLQGEVFRDILAAPPQSVCFMFLPPILPNRPRDIILALTSDEADDFTENHGTEFLDFIASLLSVSLLSRPSQ